MSSANGTPDGLLMRSIARMRRTDEPETTEGVPQVWLSGAPTRPLSRMSRPAGAFDPLDLAFFAEGESLVWDQPSERELRDAPVPIGFELSSQWT